MEAFEVQARQGFTRFMATGDELFARHLQLNEAGNFLQEAMDEYAKALELQPNDAGLLARMAQVFLRMGQPDKAEATAQKALKFLTDKTDRQIAAKIYYVLGSLQHNRNQLDEAVQSFRQAMQLGGLASSRTRMSLYHVYRDRGLQSANRHRFTDLIKGFYFFNTSLWLLPFEAERIPFATLIQLLPKMAIGWISEELGNLDEALLHYMQLHQRFPGLVCINNVIGDIYREKGELDKARFWFEMSIEKQPASVDAYYHLGRSLDLQENFAGMIETYQQLLRLLPNDAHIHCNLANAYQANQQYQEALHHYQSALHLGEDPHWKALIAQSIGNIHAEVIQDLDAAIAYYEMAKLLDPADVDIYIHLGLLYFQKDNYDNAELVYRQALQMAPRHARLASNLGYLRWLAGDVDAAIQLYQKAIEFDPLYEVPLNNLGVICLDHLGQVYQAMELFEKAIAINEEYALAFYNLGRAHSFLDNRLEAATCFQVAQNLNTVSHELDSDELTARINNLFDACALGAAEPTD